MGAAQARYRNKIPSGRRNEEHVTEGDMTSLGDNQVKGTYSECLNGGSSNTTDGTRGNRMQTEEVGLSVANVNRHPTIKEERDNRGINDGTLMLIRRLIRDACKVNGLGMLAPINTSLQSVQCGEELQFLVVKFREFTNESGGNTVASKACKLTQLSIRQRGRRCRGGEAM
jgi:hypothetical protein